MKESSNLMTNNRGMMVELNDNEGITMTSVLFCKHGGLIVAVTSGQDIPIEENLINTDTVFALACTLSGKHVGCLEIFIENAK